MARSNGCRQRGGYTRNLLESVGSVKISSPSRVPSCRIYPNGEFGLGYKHPVKLRDPLEVNPSGGVSLAHQRAVCDELATGEGQLGLSSLSNSHKQLEPSKAKAYGLKGITNYGKKMVRNGAYVIEKAVGRQNLTFLTLTVPPMSRHAAVLVAQNWGEIMRQLGQWIFRKLEREGLLSQYVLVSETQPQRLANGCLESLHVHGVFQGKRAKGPWVIHYLEIRSFWLKLLSRISGEAIESRAVERLERVKKSAENYLSKYMSKGIESVAQLIEIAGEECVPKQWWNMNNPTRKAIKSATLSGESISSVVETMINLYYQGAEGTGFKFVRAIEKQATEYQTFVVGYWGKFTPDGVAEMRDLTDALKCD